MLRNLYLYKNVYLHITQKGKGQEWEEGCVRGCVCLVDMYRYSLNIKVLIENTYVMYIYFVFTVSKVSCHCNLN